MFVSHLAFSTSGENEPKGKITHDDVITTLDSFLKGHELYSTIPFRIQTKRNIDTITTDGELEIKIVDRAREGLLKSDNFQAIILQDGKTIRRLELRQFLGIEIQVAVASRDIKRGERTDGAYEFRWRDLSGRSVRMPVYEGCDLAGQVMKVNVREGREIDRSLLEVPFLVKRGDKVVVTFISGGLTLSMNAKALGAGKLGDMIEVFNEMSGKTITVKVTGEGEVQIP